jgi:hypothetical protein
MWGRSVTCLRPFVCRAPAGRAHTYRIQNWPSIRSRESKSLVGQFRILYVRALLLHLAHILCCSASRRLFSLASSAHYRLSLKKLSAARMVTDV